MTEPLRPCACGVVPSDIGSVIVGKGMKVVFARAFDHAAKCGWVWWCDTDQTDTEAWNSAPRPEERVWRELLIGARCPNDCVRGVIIHSDGIEPCQWCAEREQLCGGKIEVKEA